jgi:hypothetical protein
MAATNAVFVRNRNTVPIQETHAWDGMDILFSESIGKPMEMPIEEVMAQCRGEAE